MDNTLLAAVNAIFGWIQDFFDVTYPGTSISVGLIGVAIISIPIVFTLIKKVFGGGT